MTEKEPGNRQKRRFEKEMRSFFYKDRRAVTALEYGLIASLIALVIIVAVSSLGVNLSHTFATVDHSITSALGR